MPAGWVSTWCWTRWPGWSAGGRAVACRYRAPTGPDPPPRSRTPPPSSAPRRSTRCSTCSMRPTRPGSTSCAAAWTGWASRSRWPTPVGTWTVHVHTDDVGRGDRGRPRGGPAVPDRRHPDRRAGAGAGRRRAWTGTPCCWSCPAPSWPSWPGPRAPRCCSASRGCRSASSELTAALAGTGAREVVLLACDPELTGLAQQAAEAARQAGQGVLVVPSHSVLQGLAALAVHDPQRRPGDDIVAMAEAAAGTRTGALAVAEEEALTWAGRCQAGDVLGVVDGEIVLIAPDLAVGALWLAHRMLVGGGELVTVLLGGGRRAGAGRRSGRRPAPGPPGDRRHRAPRRPPGPAAGAGGRNEPRTSTSTPRCRSSSVRRRPRSWPPTWTSTPSASWCGTTRAATSSAASSPTSPACSRASTPRWWPRWSRRRCATMRHRHGQMLTVVLRDDHGARLDCHLLQPVQADERDQARGAGPVRRPGRHVPGQAAAHPPAVRAAAGRRRRPAVPGHLPGRGQAAVLEDRQLRAPGARRAGRPHRSAARLAAQGRGAHRAGPGAAPHPRARDRGRSPRRPQPAGLGRGDGRAAGAGAAPAGHRVPAGAGAARRGRTGCWTRSTPGCRSADRGPGRGGQRDRRRPVRGAPDEPAGAGRRGRRQDGGRAAGDAAGDRRRPAGRAARARPRCSPPSTPARCGRCSARSGMAGQLGAADAGHRRHAAHRLAGREGAPAGAARRRSPARPASWSARTR